MYAANRRVIGPDPDVIEPGVVLVLPGRRAVARYTVAAGDTLSGIAAALAVPGGWPALYAANRRVIGPDPALIRPGTVLGIPHRRRGGRARPGPPGAAGAAVRAVRASRRSSPAAGPHHGGPAAAGLPRWLETILVAAGLVTAAAFAAEPVLLIRRRRRRAATAAAARPGPPRGPALVPPPGAPLLARPGRPRRGGPGRAGRL